MKSEEFFTLHFSLFTEIGKIPKPFREILSANQYNCRIFAPENKAKVQTYKNFRIMKKIIMTILAMLTINISTQAMSYEQARREALFLTDKMAYELNLTDSQYDAAYEINLDYLMGVTGRDNVYGTYWERRNIDLGYILLDWQYRAFCEATYFYRPLYWDAGYWHFGIYARYPHRTHFYFSRPTVYVSYRGGHSWHRNGGVSYWRDRRHTFNHSGPHTGMRDNHSNRFDRNHSGNRPNDRNNRYDNDRRHDNDRPNGNRFDNDRRHDNDRPNGNRNDNDRRHGSSTRVTVNNGNNDRPTNNNGTRFGGVRNSGNTNNSGSTSFTPQRHSTERNSSFGTRRNIGGSVHSTEATRVNSGNSSFGGSRNSSFGGSRNSSFNGTRSSSSGSKSSVGSNRGNGGSSHGHGGGSFGGGRR